MQKLRKMERVTMKEDNNLQKIAKRSTEVIQQDQCKKGIINLIIFKKKMSS
jgi:hypothetical protein